MTALSISKSRKIVVSGQNGQKPLIFIWDAETAEVIGSKKLPKGSRLVTAIAISANDKYIVASDASEKIFCHIFKVDGKSTPIADVQIGQKVVHLNFHPTEDGRFASAGKDHLAICNFDGTKKIDKKNASGKVVSQCSAAWIDDPKYPNDIITGGADGTLYHWTGNKAGGKGVSNNKGPVQCVAARADEKHGQLVLAGGNDKSLTVYKFAGSLTKMWKVTVDAAPRSVDLFQNQLLLGLKNGSIVQMPMTADGQNAEQSVIMKSHCDGEVWAMELIDFEDGSMRLITASDDNRLLAYNPMEKKHISEGSVAVVEAAAGGSPKKKGKKRGASKKKT